MRDDPAGLSGCVMTRIARHPAAAIRHGAERPAPAMKREPSLKNSPKPSVWNGRRR